MAEDKPVTNLVRENGIALKGLHEIVIHCLRGASAAGILSEKLLGSCAGDQPKRLYEVRAPTFAEPFWKHQMREDGVTDPNILDSTMGHVVKRYGGTYDIFDSNTLGI